MKGPWPPHEKTGSDLSFQQQQLLKLCRCVNSLYILSLFPTQYNYFIPQDEAIYDSVRHQQELAKIKMATTENHQTTGCEEWLLLRVGSLPRNSLGWFRCGVGFYNKKEFTKAIQCFEKSVLLDPLNVIYLSSYSLSISVKFIKEKSCSGV